MGPARALEFARRNRLRFVDELKHFLRFPSISSQARHAKDVAVCADWLADHLQRIGLLRVKLIRSPGHPIVYADWMGVPGAPIVLIYGHYDVVPAEPLKEWISPPFTPNIRGNDLYGRGACDDKGQLFVHLKALESYLRAERALPVNVKCIFEGEEEIASPNLAPFLLRNQRALHSNVAVISDTKMLGPGRPAISYSQRGVLSMELEVRGPKRTYTPEASAALFTIRFRRFARSSPGCTMINGESQFRDFTPAYAPRTGRSARIWPVPAHVTKTC